LAQCHATNTESGGKVSLTRKPVTVDEVTASDDVDQPTLDLRV
jgi:hypothetical protein